MSDRSPRFVDESALPTLAEGAQQTLERIEALSDALRKELRGEVRFDTDSRALYASDSSNFRIVPIGVVVPRDESDVIRAVALARKYKVPILPRGDGTSLAGQTCNAALVVDMSKYFNQVPSLNPTNRLARVQPGVRCDQLRESAARHGLTYGVDPATHAHCTFGGMLGNNSGGIHAMRSGITVHQVEALEILTYDGERMRVGATSDEEIDRIIGSGGRRGEIYRQMLELRDRYADVIRARLPEIPRRVSGYGLDQLLPEKGFNVARALVGTEGSCVTILEATVQLIGAKPCRTLVALGYDTVADAGDDVPRIRTYEPIALEGMGHDLIHHVQLSHLKEYSLDHLPDGSSFLLVEFGGDTQDESDQLAEQMIDSLRVQENPPTIGCFSDPHLQKQIWDVREAGLGVTAKSSVQGVTWPGLEDSAVAPDDLGAYLRDLEKLFQKYNYSGDLYGHFGQGLVHTRINFDLRSADGVAIYRNFMAEAADLIASYHGSLSGEHGDGQQRAELLERLYGRELVSAFEEFKRIWDPENMMNPGKAILANRLDRNLRLGADYAPWEPKTYFRYPDDAGSFSEATLRCVGAGKCRANKTGTMCPSFQVTNEEKHTTRGRARLLFEMLNGDETPTDWQNEGVKDALDLCLACKGCKSECPVSVDMPTYKAEFLAHYYEKNARPRVAYAFGMIDKWSKIASEAPKIVNFVTQTPGLRTMAKKMAGMARERKIPKFAEQTFRDWFEARSPAAPNADKSTQRMILFPDTFNNYFHPEKLKSAVGVLEKLGFAPELPAFQLCCGRPLYDYGLLEQAREYLCRIMATLDNQLDEDVLMVALEPSCVAVFRDELLNLFPEDPRARRLHDQTVTLGEFVQNAAPDFDFPQLARKVMVHVHCHHKSIMGDKAQREVLGRLGVDFEVLDSGCCGMAGSFGFEDGNFDISQAIGERVLLPRVQAAQSGTIVLADGFSCHTQIEQLGHRQSMHLAEVIEMAFRDAKKRH